MPKKQYPVRLSEELVKRVERVGNAVKHAPFAPLGEDPPMAKLLCLCIEAGLPVVEDQLHLVSPSKGPQAEDDFERLIRMARKAQAMAKAPGGATQEQLDAQIELLLSRSVDLLESTRRKLGSIHFEVQVEETTVPVTVTPQDSLADVRRRALAALQRREPDYEWSVLINDDRQMEVDVYSPLGERPVAEGAIMQLVRLAVRGPLPSSEGE